MTAPTRPPKLWGNTAPVIISHCVAPRANAASLFACGTVLSTSRLMEVTIGMIMIARMMPAVMKLRPVPTGSPKMRFSPGTGATTSRTHW
jgi:hypothetical protein